MLTKKFLSLSLAASLAVSASVNTFADGGQSEVAPLPSATEYSKEISENDIITLLAIPLCFEMLLEAIKFIDLPEVQAFCQQLEALKQEELKQKVLKQLKQLKRNPKVTQLATTFLDLYNDKIHPEFKEAVDAAWIIDVETGSKKHASIQCIDKHTAIPVRRLSRKYWVIDVETDRKKHASIQGIKKGKSGHYTQENYIDKHKSGKW